MPYNPCGAVVDIGAGEYRTTAKFFRDSDLEIPIRWYPALPNAPALPFPSGITTSYADRDEVGTGFPYREGVGEVWDAPRERLKPKTIPAATGLHQCGTADMFENGAYFDPDLPPRLYRPDGLPTCCVPGNGVFLFAPPNRPAGGVYIFAPPVNTFVGGASCATAVPVAFDTDYTQGQQPVSPGLWSYWFLCPGPPRGQITINGHYIVVAGGIIGAQIITGPNCSTLTLQQLNSANPFFLQLTRLTVPLFLFVVSGVNGPLEPFTPSFTFRLTSP